MRWRLTIDDSFIRPNITNSQAIELIRAAVRGRSAFAFTRFGDGEIHVLLKNGSSEFNRRACDLWGYNYPDELYSFYRDADEVVKRALVASDLHGFMSPECSLVSIEYDPMKWSLPRKYLSSIGLLPESMKIADHQLSRTRELGSFEGLRLLLEGRPFHVISPHIDRLCRIDWHTQVGSFPTFTEHPMSVNFTNRESFLRSLGSIKESVVLLGVGLQKDYGVILRDKYEKTAIDLGATIDAWAGIMSRPWFRQGGLQSYLVPDK